MKKNVLREIDVRCFWLFVALAVMCVIVVVKLFQMQIVEYDYYQQKVIDNVQQETVISADRGQIYDTNMVALATNVTTYRFFFSPKDIEYAVEDELDKDKKLTDDEKEEMFDEELKKMQALVATMIDEVSDITSDEVYEYIEKYPNRRDVTLAKDLDENAASVIRQAIEDYDLSSCVYLQASTKRYYPYGSLAASIIGFTGTDGGLLGLEMQYDSYLTGTPGRYITTKNAQSQSLASEYDIRIEPEDGLNLVTTLDVTIQSILESQLKTTYYDSQAANRVTGIVMNPNTGGIYAMATYPTFDLNDPYTLCEEYQDLFDSWKYTEEDTSEEAVTKAQNEYKWELIYRMWSNKAVNDLYEPGSTFKMVTTSIALEENAVSFSTTFTCNGRWVVGGSTIRCHKTSGHGTDTFDRMLQQSCNPTIMQVAARVGAKTFYSYFEAYGYTSKTGIDLPGESSGLYVSLSNMNSVELACYSFGQTFKTTLIQQITAISAVANGGYLVTPHVVDYMTDSDGNVVEEIGSGIKRQVVSTNVCRSILNVLQEGVSSGVGVANAYVAGYRVAAKTGTSEKRDTVDDADRIGSCVAIAPADDPQVCVIIIVDEPQISNKYGSNVAAPYVAAVLEQVLPYLGVERVYSEDEMSRIAVKVGNYQGYTTDKAISAIKKSGLSYEIVGNGNTVVSQIPANGEYVTNINGKVILYTDAADVQMVTVPNITNMSASVAIKQLYALGLNVYIDGATNFDSAGGAVVIQQSVQEGTRVAYGSVIEIECRYLDGTD